LERRITLGERVFPTETPDHIALLRAGHALLVRADDEGESAADDRRRAHLFSRKVLATLPGFAPVADDDIEGLITRLESSGTHPGGLAHVAMASWCALIPTLSLFDQLPAAKTCLRGLEVAAKVDARFANGAALRALAYYRLRAPMIVGGDAAEGLAIAKRALKLAPDFAPNRVVHALAQQAVACDEAAFEARLKEIVALGDDGAAGDPDLHRRGKADAARRLAEHDARP